MLGRGTKACGDSAASDKPRYRSPPDGELNPFRFGVERVLRGEAAREVCDEVKGEAKPRSLLTWFLLGVTRKEDDVRGGKAGFLINDPLRSSLLPLYWNSEEFPYGFWSMEAVRPPCGC